MKCLLAVVLFVGIASRVECLLPENKMNFVDECMKDLEIKSEEEFPIDTNDPKVKCFKACMLKKLEYLVDGKVTLDKALKSLEEQLHGNKRYEVQKKELTECIDKANNETDECEVASELHECMERKIGVHH